MTRRSRTLAGAGFGLLLWGAGTLLVEHFPAAIGFYLTAFALVLGCGALPLARFDSDLSRGEQIALACSFGTIISPLVMLVMAVCHAGAAFPPLAFAATGAAIGRWLDADAPRAARTGGTYWYVILPLVVFAAITWVSAGRLTVTHDGLAIFGDYETLDLSYYAAIASEFDHTTIVPPLSPFYAGHRIIYSYFPLAFLAAVHKYSGVSITRAFLEFGWPFFGAVTAAALFTFCRRLGSVTFSVLTTLLVFFGSGFAYVAVMIRPDTAQFDPLIWSSMFLAPSAEWLFFNPWTPALGVVATGLYALTRLDERRWTAWGVVASLCFGQLFMFKSFAFAVIVPALVIAGAVGLVRGGRSASWRLVLVAGGAVASAAPWLAAILPYNQADNRGAQVTVDWFSLVHRMLFKMNLTDTVVDFVHRYIGSDPTATISLGVATLVFLAGGLGMRCFGVVPLFKAAIGERSMARWTPLSWIAIVGIALSFVFAIAPFPNSIQPYMFGLFAMWPFAVFALWPPDASASLARWTGTAVLVCASVPATVHYARAAHQASAGTPVVSLGAGDYRIIRYLQQRTDVDRTLLLHSEPLWPSLYTLEAGRRVVLAWSSYVEGDGSADVDERTREIQRLFGTVSDAGTDDVSILKRYHVTHVIERIGRDRLHPHVIQQLTLLTGTPDVRLYEVPASLAP